MRQRIDAGTVDETILPFGKDQNRPWETEPDANEGAPAGHLTNEELKAIQTGQIPLPPGSHEEKVMQATFRYITAYGARKNAATEIETSQAAVTSALEKANTAIIEQEAARNELFDLISLDEVKVR